MILSTLQLPHVNSSFLCKCFHHPLDSPDVPPKYMAPPSRRRPRCESVLYLPQAVQQRSHHAR